MKKLLSKSVRAAACSAAVTGLLAACAVGPNFQPAAAPDRQLALAPTAPGPKALVPLPHPAVPVREAALPPTSPAVWTPAPAHVESKTIEPPVPPPAFLPKRAAPTSHGRTVSIAVVTLLVIGAAIWVDRYRNPEQPIPVQQADPEHSPLSPPPEDARQPEETPKPQHKPEPTPAPTPTPAAQKGPQPDEGGASTATKPVRLSSAPPGAQIEVDHDATLACIAPCTLELPAGRHTLEAKSWGTAVERRIFNVPNDTQVTVTLASSVGTLLVSSSPPGALVLVDGADRGNTPATIRLPAGHHQITVINGSRRTDDSVEIENDQLTTRNYQW